MRQVRLDRGIPPPWRAHFPYSTSHGSRASAHRPAFTGGTRTAATHNYNAKVLQAIARSDRHTRRWKAALENSDPSLDSLGRVAQFFTQPMKDSGFGDSGGAGAHAQFRRDVF